MGKHCQVSSMEMKGVSEISEEETCVSSQDREPRPSVEVT